MTRRDHDTERLMFAAAVLGIILGIALGFLTGVILCLWAGK